ncbi:MAG: hypothetical protein AB7O65_08800 [Candidatus Korobacteraceae bacterium]
MSVAVLPSGSEASLLVATIRRTGAASSPAMRSVAADKASEPRMVATGFLGLVDELVWEDEEKPEPKSWWRKLAG